jgi:Xaa-Pro aminopeptidase
MPTIVQEKVAQAVTVLDELNIDCWLTFARETTETGDPILPIILGQPVTWQSTLIITSTKCGGETIAIVGKFEDEAVKSTGAWKKVLPYVQSIRSPLTTTLARLNPRKIAVNYSMDEVKADGLSHGMMLLLKEYLAETPFIERLISAGDVIRALRSRKTNGEIERIRRAIATTDEIFSAVTTMARPGMSERAISDFMHAEVDRRAGGRSTRLATAWERAMCPIVTTGPKSMVGHGLPSETLMITPGCVFHIDFGVRQDEYCSDIQRLWYVLNAGETAPPTDVQKAFDTVRRAILNAFDALKPGGECWTIDAIARKTITDAGYPEYQHATGHTVGRAAHDGGGVLGPKWERYGHTPMYRVEAGNVFTLELGIDILNRGYLGLEEMALVTPRGAEWLTQPQAKIMTIAG